ncbi:MAG: hypothetical protein CMN76_11490 [Spirochaetaceae bacterium]|nr:hypothetical protein [Spirochaetaceae bacterium]|tara:strand:+ start:7807 stop:8859 length:1053 start_codon:yes stop_codon:yes gene_type:complete
MPTEVSFVICNNGFGHAKRVALVVPCLADFGVRNFRFLSGPGQIEYLQRALADKMAPAEVRLDFSSDPFRGVSTPNEDYPASGRWMEGAIDWLNSAKGVVVSDNYPSVLSVRRCILMGSFLWSEVFVDSKKPSWREQALRESAMLRERKPSMIGVQEMAMPQVRLSTRFFPCPWFGQPSEDRAAGFYERSGILLSSGAGFTNRDFLCDLFCELSAREVGPLYVDGGLQRALESRGVTNSALFDFKPESFSALRLIVGRPGMGLLSDCVMHGVPLVATGLINESEMLHNAAQMNLLGIGIYVTDPKKSIETIEKAGQDSFVWQGMHTALMQRPLGGEKFAAERILEDDSEN